ncbi:zinc-ribbon domain-containing protein [Paenibacillus daejeonensis]|uniref:zinc-ribbon domain-containing protein n=1 Tax=Paenibacillus daejeonensis TaxID=135193 RepID=UPI00036C072D|nr:zinc-ribbon domain-containing protein [Paenibacillus daejeonensis]
MFCSQCGKKVPPESRFCPHCGAQRDAADIRPNSGSMKETTPAAGDNSQLPTADASSGVAPVEEVRNPDDTSPMPESASLDEPSGEDADPYPDPSTTSTPVDEVEVREASADARAVDGEVYADELDFSQIPDTESVSDNTHNEQVPRFAYPSDDPNSGNNSDDRAVQSRETSYDRALEEAETVPHHPAEEATVVPAEEVVVRPAPSVEPANSDANRADQPVRPVFVAPPVDPTETINPRVNNRDRSSRESASSMETADGAAPSPKRRGAAYHLLWIMPLTSLILVLLAGGGLYLYHEQTHQEVRSLLAQGEELALDGQLPEGLARIEQALAKQPEHPVLLEHQTLLEDAVALEQNVAAARGQIEQEQHEEAATTIAEVKQELERRSGPIYNHLQTAVQELESASIVANTRAEFASLTTVSELIPLMNRLRDYESEEAETLKEEIREKAVEVVKKRVNALTATKNYPAALSAVDEALSLAPNHEELTALKASITEAQAKYEAEEAQKIRDALEEAKQGQQGQGDSQQSPVEVLNMKVQLDASGRFHIQGILKNISSRTLPSLLLHYEIYDQNDQLLEKHTMRPSPLTLEAGAEAEFEAYHEDGENMYRAIIKRVEWGV